MILREEGVLSALMTTCKGPAEKEKRSNFERRRAFRNLVT